MTLKSALKLATSLTFLLTACADKSEDSGPTGDTNAGTDGGTTDGGTTDGGTTDGGTTDGGTTDGGTTDGGTTDGGTTDGGTTDGGTTDGGTTDGGTTDGGTTDGGTTDGGTTDGGTTDGGTTDTGGPMGELNDARDLWAASAISDYSYELQWLCFCTQEYSGPAIVQVRGGVAVGGIYSDGSGPVVADFRLATFDDLFDQVEAGLTGADLVNVTYEKTYGFPDYAYIDWSAKIADEEDSWRAGSFTPK